MLIFVRSSGSNLSRAVNLHHYRSESTQRALREQSKHSERTKKALKEHLEY